MLPLPAVNEEKTVISNEAGASRYEALVRLAEIIRSLPEEKDLFQTIASELHQVLPFDGLSQFDPEANWVQWHFVEPYNRQFKSHAVSAIPKEETLAWWVYRNQQPVSIQCSRLRDTFPGSAQTDQRVRNSLAVRAAIEHGAPKAGKSGVCQPHRQRVFH